MNNLPIKGYRVISDRTILNLLEPYDIHPKQDNMWMYTHALTHSSYRHETGVSYDYEKLEFLGDAALEWVVTNYIFARSHDLTEGQMTAYRAGLVCKQSLTRASEILGLSKIALFGKGMTNISNSIKEDLFEALLGAIAQDVGIKKVSHLVNEVIIKPYENHEFELQRHFKTEIQEIFAPRTVKYHVVRGELDFVECNVLVDGLIYGTGRGTCQREAEENAAKDAYEKHCQPIESDTSSL